MENKAYQFVGTVGIVSRHDEWIITASKDCERAYLGWITNCETGQREPIAFNPSDYDPFHIPEDIPTHIQARARVCFKRLYRKCQELGAQ